MLLEVAPSIISRAGFDAPPLVIVLRSTTLNFEPLLIVAAPPAALLRYTDEIVLLEAFARVKAALAPELVTVLRFKMFPWEPFTELAIRVNRN